MFQKHGNRGRAKSSQQCGHYRRIIFPPKNSQSTPSRQDTNYNNISDYNPLFLAVHRGNLKLTHSLLRENPVNEKLFGKSLMHVAAARGHEEVICLLCTRNASVEIGDRDGNTPLHLAIKGNHTDVVNLLTNKDTAKISNRHKETPLHFAVAKSNIPFVEILLVNGASANVKDGNGETPLHLAVQKENANLKIISLLLSHGASVNVHSHAEVTPLFIAVSLENNEVIKLLINHGALIDLENKNGISCLGLGVQKNNAETVKHLLASDGKDPLEEMDKMTPLHYASQNGNCEIVKLLMDNGYDNVNAKNENFQTPLYYAAINGHLELLKHFLDNGAKIELATSGKESLLHECVIINRIDVLKILIDHGAMIDVKTWQAETPLHFSVSHNRLNIFNYLVKRGADIHATTLSGETPLYLAVKAGNDKIIGELLKWGADINSLNTENNSALVLVVKSRNKEILQLLLSKEDKDKLFISQSQLSIEEKVLHIAAKNGDDDILKMLLEAGCPRNTDEFGKNALHVAATFGHTKSVKTLIEAGVGINSQTEFFETPLYLAAVSGWPSVVRFLIDAGAETNNKFFHKSYFRASILEYLLNRRKLEAIKQERSFHLQQRLETVNSDPDLHVTSFMFEKYVKITELLLIKTDPDGMESSFTRLIEYASQMRVLNENVQKNAKAVEFRPDIVRCILNYSNETLLTLKLNTVIDFAVESKLVQLIDILLEYDIKNRKSNFHIDCLNSDPKIILALIDHIYDMDQLLMILYNRDIQREVNFFRNASEIEEVIHLTAVNDPVIYSTLDLNKSTYMNVLKLLVARLVQTRSISKSSNIPSSQELQILNNYNLSDWYSQCEVQIMNMRESKIHLQFDVTYYDILTKPINKLANYVGRKDFLKVLEFSYQKFSAYSKFLERSVDKAMKRKDAIDSAAECMFNIISNKHNIELPSLVIDNIFKYLSVIDLRKLSAVRKPSIKHIKPLNAINIVEGNRI